MYGREQGLDLKPSATVQGRIGINDEYFSLASGITKSIGKICLQ